MTTIPAPAATVQAAEQEFDIVHGVAPHPAILDLSDVLDFFPAAADDGTSHAYGDDSTTMGGAILIFDPGPLEPVFWAF